MKPIVTYIVLPAECRVSSLTSAYDIILKPPNLPNIKTLNPLGFSSIIGIFNIGQVGDLNIRWEGKNPYSYPIYIYP